jgi:putative SOS response-associated peptidase YedK
MCGRARLASDVSEINLVFSIPPERPAPNVAPNWNVAPTDPLPIVHYDAKAGTRDLEVMRWGLIPYWAKDIKIGFSTINGRAEESTASRPSARRSSAGAVSCRSTIFMNGRRQRPANSPMRSRWRKNQRPSRTLSPASAGGAAMRGWGRHGRAVAAYRRARG